MVLTFRRASSTIYVLTTSKMNIFPTQNECWIDGVCLECESSIFLKIIKTGSPASCTASEMHHMQLIFFKQLVYLTKSEQNATTQRNIMLYSI